jgi:hypothetical protein
MKTYKVTIIETLEMEVKVKAKSLDEAEQKVTDRWNNDYYILDSKHFSEVDFKAEEVPKVRTHER